MVLEEVYEVELPDKIPARPVTAEGKQSGGEAWRALSTNNATLAAWLVFIGFGGALLALYFSHIHYFPDIDWKESFTYLAAISIFGGGLVGVYSLLLYLPGVLWSKYLISDEDLRAHFCYSDHKEHWHPCFHAIGKHLVCPFAGAMVLIHLAMREGWTVVYAISSFCLIGMATYSHSVFETVWEDMQRKQIPDRGMSIESLRTKYWVTASAGLLSSIVSLLILYSIVAGDLKSGPLPLFCTIIVVISNLFVAVQFENSKRGAALTGILTAMVLLFGSEILADPHAALSSRIFETFGLGGRNVVVLSLTAQEGRLLKASGFSVEIPAGGNRDVSAVREVKEDIGQSAVLREARILSRLGKEYFVEVQGRKVAIPKDAVLSWATDQTALTAPAKQRAGSF